MFRNSEKAGGVNADYAINVGPVVRNHRWEIADAVACHDIPGMPSLAELTEEQQARYLDFADQVLNMSFRVVRPHREHLPTEEG